MDQGKAGAQALARWLSMDLGWCPLGGTALLGVEALWALEMGLVRLFDSMKSICILREKKSKKAKKEKKQKKQKRKKRKKAKKKKNKKSKKTEKKKLKKKTYKRKKKEKFDVSIISAQFFHLIKRKRKNTKILKKSRKKSKKKSRKKKTTKKSRKKKKKEKKKKRSRKTDQHKQYSSVLAHYATTDEIIQEHIDRDFLYYLEHIYLYQSLAYFLYLTRNISPFRNEFM